MSAPMSETGQEDQEVLCGKYSTETPLSFPTRRAPARDPRRYKGYRLCGTTVGLRTVRTAG